MDVGTLVEQQISIAVAALKLVAYTDSRASHALKVLLDGKPQTDRQQVADWLASGLHRD